MRIKEYIDKLAASGRYHFSNEEAQVAIGGSEESIKQALNRVRKKKEIASLYRKFNLILSPEHRKVGCLPPFEFVPQLMEHIGSPYYIGALSAAERHGVAHYRPQVFQVVTDINRRPVSCGKVIVQFLANKNIKNIPTEYFNTRTGVARVSTKEATAFDLVSYTHRAGGLGNVALILQDLGEELNSQLLFEIAKFYPTSCAQRLGYLLEYLGHKNKSKLLLEYVKNQARHYVPLSVQNSASKVERNKFWKVNINISLELN